VRRLATAAFTSSTVMRDFPMVACFLLLQLQLPLFCAEEEEQAQMSRLWLQKMLEPTIQPAGWTLNTSCLAPELDCDCDCAGVLPNLLS
jgi:hypothetical protein